MMGTHISESKWWTTTVFGNMQNIQHFFVESGSFKYRVNETGYSGNAGTFVQILVIWEFVTYMWYIKLK